MHFLASITLMQCMSERPVKLVLRRPAVTPSLFSPTSRVRNSIRFSIMMQTVSPRAKPWALKALAYWLDRALNSCQFNSLPSHTMALWVPKLAAFASTRAPKQSFTSAGRGVMPFFNFSKAGSWPMVAMSLSNDIKILLCAEIPDRA